MLLRLLVRICAAFAAWPGAAMAQTTNWARYALISPTTTLSAGRFCYTDGVGIACDSNAPLLTGGLVAGDRITSGTTSVVAYNGSAISITVAGTNVANINSGGLGITAINASARINSEGISTTAVSGTTGYFSRSIAIGTSTPVVSQTYLDVMGNGAANSSMMRIRGYGIGAGQTGIFYGISLSVVANSNATGAFGISAELPSTNGSGNSIAVYGRTTRFSSFQSSIGVYGLAAGNPGAYPALLPNIGVYGEASSTSITGSLNNYYGGFFRSTAVEGGNSYGLYADAVAGPVNVVPLRVDYQGTEIFRVSSMRRVGIGGVPSPTAALHVSGTVFTTSWTAINFTGSNVTPSAPLEVSGTVSATMVRAGSLRVTAASAACAVAADIGNHRQNGGFLEVCSPYPP